MRSEVGVAYRTDIYLKPSTSCSLSIIINVADFLTIAKNFMYINISNIYNQIYDVIQIDREYYTQLQGIIFAIDHPRIISMIQIGQ
jgi:hypothetical protein